ncbi:MAG: NAD-binding oxidoreductase [Myxococcota bacterium]|nr:NAD-binding oxidoreductase [Myxococcota bacterium]
MGGWYQTRVISTRASAAGLTEVHLDVKGTPLEGAHQRPGQFVRLTLEGKGEGFFAIASSPGADPHRLELLVKAGTPLTEALVSLRPGELVLASKVEGVGFPVERAEGGDVLLFATGSGISPLRSLVGVLLRHRGRFGRLSLFFGVRTPDGFAYTADLELWRRAGMEVVQTVSQPGDSGWEGLTGYVQEHVPTADLSGAAAFLCGQAEMVHGVTDVLIRRGLPRDRIFLNY